MIPDVNTGDRNTALFLMASLSPKVKETIELELYRQTADSDGSSEQYVLEESFLNLVRDLETLGLILTIDYSEIVEELSTIYDFIRFVSYLLPNSLYEILRTQPKIRECVRCILEGSLGNHETLIQTYLSQLGGLDGEPALVPHLTPVLERYYSYVGQTATFTDYFRHLMELLSTERLAVEYTEDDHKAYRDTIRDFLGRFSDAVNLFSAHPLYDPLCRIQDRLIKDLAAHDNFADYRYIFVERPDQLPEDLVEGYHRRWYHYKVSHPWCLEYFSLRKLLVKPEQILAIFCFLYAHHETKDAYEKEAALVRIGVSNDHPDTPILNLYQE